MELLITTARAGTARPAPLLLLAHGAGAPMTSPFLETLAQLLASRGVDVARFEFGYMAQRRTGGSRRPPPKAELLRGEYLAAVAQVPAGAPLLIGGKSMGGRVASLVADGLHRSGRIVGIVCLGYPFHPAGKPQQLRTAHLEGLVCPSLIVQGERDPLGGCAEVEGYALPASIRLHWIAGGDHDLAPPASPGVTRKQAAEAALADATDAVARFASGRAGGHAR